MHTCMLLMKACTPEGKPRFGESQMVSKSLTFHLRVLACHVGLNSILWGGFVPKVLLVEVKPTYLGAAVRGIRVLGRLLLASPHLNEGNETERVKLTVRMSQVFCLLCKCSSN